MEFGLFGMAKNAFLGLGKLLESRQFPTFGIKEVILAGVNGDGNRVTVVDTRLVLAMERLPGGLTRFRFDKNVDATLHVILIAPCDVLVIKNATKFPYTVPCIIGLDVVDDVIVRNDFFILVVDKTLELDTFGLLLKIVFGKVVVDKGNDFGSMSCTSLRRVMSHQFFTVKNSYFIPIANL